MKQTGQVNDKFKSISSADFAPKVDPTAQISQPGAAAQNVHATSSSMFGETDIAVQELGRGGAGNSERPKKAM